MILLQLLFGDFIDGYHTFWSFSPCTTPLPLILLLWNSSLFLTSPSYLHVSVVCDPLGLPRVASVCTSGSYLLEPGQVTSGYITEENGSSSPRQPLATNRSSGRGGGLWQTRGLPREGWDEGLGTSPTCGVCFSSSVAEQTIFFFHGFGAFFWNSDCCSSVVYFHALYPYFIGLCRTEHRSMHLALACLL